MPWKANEMYSFTLTHI